jgi:hypothetical protein
VLPHRASDLDGDSASDKSDGELFEELEEDEEAFDWGGFREKRMEQLKEESVQDADTRTRARAHSSVSSDGRAQATKH